MPLIAHRPRLLPARGLAALIGAVRRRLFGDRSLVEADADALLAAYGTEAEWAAKFIGAEYYERRQFRTAGHWARVRRLLAERSGRTIGEKAADKYYREMHPPLYGRW